MEIKKQAKKLRDSLQQLIYKIINPLVHGMIKIGITPNIVTTIGFLGNLAGACLLIYAGINQEVNHYNLIGWAGGIILCSSLFDMMDGQVARIGGMASTFGAMYDSVLDRYSELVTLGGICFCLIGHNYSIGAVITFAALIGSLMVSYVRARAEGLGLECKIGFMQRPERVVLTSLGLLVCGIVATQNPHLSFDPMLILIVPMGFIAIFANITAFARIEYSRRQISSHMKIMTDKPSTKEIMVLAISLVAWISVTAAFIGIRPEHIGLGCFIAVLFLISRATRKLVVALLPFAIFGISYDWMRIIPNYEVNPIDVKGLYETEKSIFGIATAERILTPNEFFHIHHCPAMDFMAGIFYLCWVPVPILFGLGLYFTRQRKTYLHFALVFLFVNLIGFTGYYIHPAAPPWYVMNYGFEPILNTPGDVAGLGRFDAMTGLTVFQGLYGRNANVFAAVPSLHSAYMVVALFYSFRARCSNWLRIVFAFIMAGIWFTAVYSGHHYIIDVTLGILCALLGICCFEYILMRIPKFRNFVARYTQYIE